MAHIRIANDKHFKFPNHLPDHIEEARISTYTDDHQTYVVGEPSKVVGEEARDDGKRMIGWYRENVPRINCDKYPLRLDKTAKSPNLTYFHLVWYFSRASDRRKLQSFARDGTTRGIQQQLQEIREPPRENLREHQPSIQ